MTVSDALRHGFLDRGRKHFCNAHTGDVCSLDEALRKGWILTKSNYDKPNRTQAGFSLKGTTTVLHVKAMNAVMLLNYLFSCHRAQCYTQAKFNCCIDNSQLSFSIVKQLPKKARLVQGIIDPTGTETFAKEPKLAKLLRKLKPTLLRCH